MTSIQQLAHLFVIVCCCTFSFATAQAQDDAEMLIAAWQERSKNITSAEYEWTAEHFRNNKIMSMFRPSGSDAPEPEIVKHQERYSLSVDGQKQYYFQESYAWDAKTQSYIETPYVSVFDGQEAQSLWKKSINGYPSGTIFREKRHSEAVAVPSAPILLAYRPMDNPNAPIQFTPQSLRDSCKRVTFRGKEMLKVSQSHGNLMCEAWVDSSASFSVARFVLSSEGRTQWEANVEHDARGNPTAWTLQFWSKKAELVESYDARVTSCVINPMIPADRFSIDFPPDTAVYDQRTNKQFIVRANGDPREVLPSELSASYETLLNTETGKALTQVDSRRSWTGIAITLLLIGVLICMLLKKRATTLHISTG
jgi:hypothetical protein